jgi:single-strand DNA-binding protein
MLQGFMVGRIGKDAELRSAKNAAGTKLSNFSLAVETGYGERKKTLWIDCVVWGTQAEALTPYLVKGKQVAVLGELDVRAWKSDRDTEPHATIQLSVSELTLCGSAAPKGTGPAPTS